MSRRILWKCLFALLLVTANVEAQTITECINGCLARRGTANYVQAILQCTAHCARQAIASGDDEDPQDPQDPAAPGGGNNVTNSPNGGVVGGNVGQNGQVGGVRANSIVRNDHNVFVGPVTISPPPASSPPRPPRGRPQGGANRDRDRIGRLPRVEALAVTRSSERLYSGLPITTTDAQTLWRVCGLSALVPGIAERGVQVRCERIDAGDHAGVALSLVLRYVAGQWQLSPDGQAALDEFWRLFQVATGHQTAVTLQLGVYISAGSSASLLPCSSLRRVLSYSSWPPVCPTSAQSGSSEICRPAGSAGSIRLANNDILECSDQLPANIASAPASSPRQVTANELLATLRVGEGENRIAGVIGPSRGSSQIVRGPVSVEVGGTEAQSTTIILFSF